MNKETAKLYDEYLLEIIQTPNRAFTSEMFPDQFIQTALADGFIEAFKHPNAPEHNFGVYTITPTGVKFIVHEGGYTRKRRYKNYEQTNIRFTWIRHWVWFYTALCSLALNLILIVLYLSK